jgi:hypothetical protein
LPHIIDGFKSIYPLASLSDAITNENTPLKLKSLLLRLFVNIYIDEEVREPIRLTQVYNVNNTPQENY